MAYSLRILIVEDEPDLRFLFEETHAADGYLVTAVRTARHGTYVLRNQEFEILVCNMSLPDADGPA